MTPFDLEAVHDVEIAPLMDKIYKICETYGIPMLASFCYKADEKHTLYCTTHQPGAEGRCPHTMMVALGVMHNQVVVMDVERKPAPAAPEAAPAEVAVETPAS